MKEIVSNKMLFYNEKTGQREPVDLLRGESAYEAAVRLGQTTLSEEEWLEEYNANRDAAISAINARQAEATQAVASAGATQVNSIAAKGAETLATIPEDYAKLSSDVTTLTQEIDEIATGHVNLLQRVERHDGYLYPFGGTTPEANAACNCFERIRIYAGVTYYFKSLWRNFTSVYYDDGEFTQLPGTDTGIVYGEFVPTKNGYIYVTIESTSTKYLFTTSEELNDSEKNDTYYTPNKLRVKPVYHVEKDGSGDFTKLIDAVNEACKHMDATVYVGAGVWDIVEEYGEAFFEAAAGAGAPGSIYRGLYLKNRVHLIFSSKALVTCHYTGSNATVNAWFAVFNAGPHGFTLENATIEASNIRYVIHDERDSDTERYVNRYINCRMTFDNTNNPRTGKVSTCIGGGLGCDGYIDIEGCVFNSIDSNAAGHITAVTFHNSASANAKNHISIRNCYFMGLGFLRINAYGDSTEITNCEVTGCSMGRDILVGHETGGTNMNVHVTEWNNTIR